MNFFVIVLLTLCFHAALYFRHTTRYLKTVLTSTNPLIFEKRFYFLPPMIGMIPIQTYLQKPFVKNLRLAGLIVMSLSALIPIINDNWWGSIIIIIIGGGLVFLRKLSITIIDKQIDQAKIFLIISAIVTFIIFIIYI